METPVASALPRDLSIHGSMLKTEALMHVGGDEAAPAGDAMRCDAMRYDEMSDQGEIRVRSRGEVGGEVGCGEGGGE